MDLILWRHAEAEDIGPDNTDASRRLTPKGQEQARKMAAWLNKHIPSDTQILVSPATRTLQTADTLNHPYEIVPSIGVSADLASLLSIISFPRKANTLLLVGHQPVLGECAAYLMCGEKLSWAVKKGASWWLRYENTQQPQASLIALTTPRFL